MASTEHPAGECYAVARGQFCASFLDTKTQTFAFANAGHPAPLLCGIAGPEYLEFSETFLPIGIDDTSLPTVRTIALPDASLLVLYTDGLIEHDRMAIDGSAQLREATTFAYNFRARSSANFIERQMHLLNGGLDDAAILTAWIPQRFDLKALPL